MGGPRRPRLARYSWNPGITPGWLIPAALPHSCCSFSLAKTSGMGGGVGETLGAELDPGFGSEELFPTSSSDSGGRYVDGDGESKVALRLSERAAPRQGLHDTNLARPNPFPVAFCCLRDAPGTAPRLCLRTAIPLCSLKTLEMVGLAVTPVTTAWAAPSGLSAS